MINKNKTYKKLKVFLGVILILLVIGGVAFGSTYILLKSKLSNIKSVYMPMTKKQLGINEVKVPTDTSITNILLMGIDTRDPNTDPGHSDSMMILTIDKKNNKLKLTSIMRDSYVNIDGYASQKITNAHEFGGALLSIKTVNENYDMNIKDFIQVNFFSLAKIIDKVGGVPINVSADEIVLANTYIDNTSSIEHTNPTHITKPGLQVLNGSQAVGYSRIRYVGNNDFQRTERQRTVLTALFEKLKSTNITNIANVVNSIIPYFTTSLKPDNMISLGAYILTHNMLNVEESRIPYDDLYKNAVINGADVLTWDKQATIDRLHQFIFGAGNK